MSGSALGVRIKRAREQAGKTQAQLAEDLGVKQPSVSGWEQGAAPGYERLTAIAEACGVRVSWLLGEESNEPPAAA